MEAEVSSLAVSHVRQMTPAEATEGHEGVPSTKGPLGQELQVLVDTMEAPLDTAADQASSEPQGHLHH